MVREGGSCHGNLTQLQHLLDITYTQANQSSPTINSAPHLVSMLQPPVIANLSSCWLPYLGILPKFLILAQHKPQVFDVKSYHKTVKIGTIINTFSIDLYNLQLHKLSIYVIVKRETYGIWWIPKWMFSHQWVHMVPILSFNHLHPYLPHMRNP